MLGSNIAYSIAKCLDTLSHSMRFLYYQAMSLVYLYKGHHNSAKSPSFLRSNSIHPQKKNEWRFSRGGVFQWAVELPSQSDQNLLLTKLDHCLPFQ